MDWIEDIEFMAEDVQGETQYVDFGGEIEGYVLV
jgi:hypothetical protein